MKEKFPSLHLITEINPVSKILHVKTRETMDNVHNKPNCNKSPFKNIILGLKPKTFDLLQTKLSGASHQLSRLQLIAAVQHIIQLEQIN